MPARGAAPPAARRPGQEAAPRAARPGGYWYEQGGVTDPFWLGAFEFEEAGSADAAWQALGRPAAAAYVGNELERAAGAGLAPNPKPLVSRLDWLRSYKDDYEVRSLEEATVLGARGHRAAREAFAGGASELEVHQAFCRAVDATEAQLPYPTIVAQDEKGATLHYESKRQATGARVLLLDAGAQARGYACDITRTTPAQGCDPRFVELVEALDAVELDLARAATPGRPYLEVHLQAHAGIARVLSDLRILRVSAEEAFAKGYTHPFFPHGVGHHLGIQVHDVAGRQADPAGERRRRRRSIPTSATRARSSPGTSSRSSPGSTSSRCCCAASVPGPPRRRSPGRRSTRSSPSAACGWRTTCSSPLPARAT